MRASFSATRLRLDRLSWASVLLLCLPAVAGAQAATILHCQPAVVGIHAFDTRDGHLADGEAFFIDVGHVVTDRRLLASAHSAAITIGAKEYPVTAVLGEDREAQLVLLSVDLPDGSPSPLAVSLQSPHQGDRVTLLPRTVRPGAALTVYEGTVSELHDMPGFGSVFTTTIAEAAAAGTPLVGPDERVVGIASAITIDGQTTRFFIPASRLRGLARVQPQPVSEWASAAGAGAGHDTSAYDEGIRLATARRFDAALPYFRKVVDTDATNADALLGLCDCLEQLGRRDEAVAAYKHGLDAHPADARMWYRLGILFSDLTRWGEAVEAFARVAALRPADAHSHYNMGVAYAALGRPQDEAAAYSQAIRLDPENRAAYNNLGVAYITLKQYDDAVAALARAVKLSPEDADVRANLGVALADAGRPREAVAALREAVGLAPGSAKAHFSLGMVLLSLGDEKAAGQEEAALRGLDAKRAQALAAAISRQRTVRRQ